MWRHIHHVIIFSTNIFPLIPTEYLPSLTLLFIYHQIHNNYIFYSIFTIKQSFVHYFYYLQSILV